MSGIPDLLGAAGDYVLTCRTDALDPDIQDGDQLVVRPQETAEPGQAVVAMVDGEAQLVRFWPQMQGRVIGLIVGLYRSVV